MISAFRLFNFYCEKRYTISKEYVRYFQFDKMMFSSSHKISIASPCHENWEQMLPHERGKFCNSCAKVVTDFSTMSEREIITYFKPRPQNVCGRFTQQQLNQHYQLPVQLQLPFYRRAIKYVLTLFLLGKNTNKLKAQENTVQVMQHDSLQATKDTLKPIMQDSALVECRDTIPAVDDSTEVAKLDSLHVDQHTTSLLVNYYELVNIDAMPMGAVRIEPSKPPIIEQLFPDTINRALVKLKKAFSQKEKDNKPVPKKREEPLAATLPEGIARRKEEGTG
jgi:hypothetical protein